MNVELTDKMSLETGPVSLDVKVDDLTPLTAAPPPIPARRSAGRLSSVALPPPIPRRAARGTQAPARPRTQTSSGIVSVVAPRASAEMMASWQINPERPLAPASMPSPPPIPLAAKMIALAPLTASATHTLTGNAPSVMVEAPAQVAAPIVRQELVPPPRESRVEPLPTKQPGADVADLPAWPVRATLPLPSRRATTVSPVAATIASPARISSRAWTRATPVLIAPETAAPRISALDGSDAWVFEDDYEERRVDGEVVPTTYFERTETGARRLRPRHLVAAGAAAAAIALIVGIAMHSPSESSSPRSPIATKVAAAEVVAQPVLVIAPTPLAAKPNLTSFPITSWPTGAVVTLVDNGAPSVLGPTPVNAALDPLHSYDVMLAVAGRATTLRHIDLATKHELAVDLDADPSLAKLAAHTATPAAPFHPAAAAARQPAAAVPVAHPHHHSAPSAAIVTPSFDTPMAPPRQVALASAVGNGMLMISAKPPCEIIIDGKSTHLTTPQRSIAVAAGPHTVMLVNASIGIKKSIAVKVDAKKPTKLIQDFTKS